MTIYTSNKSIASRPIYYFIIPYLQTGFPSNIPIVWTAKQSSVHNLEKVNSGRRRRKGIGRFVRETERHPMPGLRVETVDGQDEIRCIGHPIETSRNEGWMAVTSVREVWPCEHGCHFEFPSIAGPSLRDRRRRWSFYTVERRREMEGWSGWMPFRRRPGTQAWYLVQGYTLFRAEDKRGKREARPTASFIIAGAH